MTQYFGSWHPIGENTYRMIVPNGWIVRYDISVPSHKLAPDYQGGPTTDWYTESSMVFVPDENHEWDDFLANMHKVNEIVEGKI